MKSNKNNNNNNDKQTTTGKQNLVLIAPIIAFFIQVRALSIVSDIKSIENLQGRSWNSIHCFLHSLITRSA